MNRGILSSVLVFFCTLLLINSIGFKTAEAAVWQSSSEWNDEWEARYSNWIASSVGPNFFKDLGKPFSGLKIDCADAHYALLAYFSRLHGLHLKINNAKTTNAMTRYDDIVDADKRLVAFINYMSAHFGTEALAHNDTIPVGIRSVKPGDLFMYKVSNNGAHIRHTYIVKNINIDGTFDVLYSTQARRDAGLPLNRHESYMFKKAPFNTGVDKYHWGFRRQKKSSLTHISQEDLSESDFSQYKLAFDLLNKLGSTQGRLSFFREVKKANQSINESPNRIAERNFKNVCHSVQDRVGAVQSGVDHNNKLGGKCMNYGDFDAYSTPSRDSGIMDEYRNYAADVNEVSHENLNDYNKSVFISIFKEADISSSEIKSLESSCQIKTSIGEMNLGTFKRDLFALKVSYHPNDNIYRRWGQESGSKTRCEEFYGYPN